MIGIDNNNKAPPSDNPGSMGPIADKINGDRDENLEFIKGKSLEVYYFLVNNRGEHGVRAIQRSLNYKSSSLAAYHLNRLYLHNLVEKTQSGNYYVEGDPVKLGSLKDHFKLAGYMVPNILIYSYQGIITIIASIIFLILGVRPIMWFLFFVSLNILFLLHLTLKARYLSRKLRIGAFEENDIK